ncbi:M56 family metallopeptidase [Chitinophaga polysaccharea]|uniref:M56 family metallopeptidase n=1 Tax=Chitinophaga polysaccharea TaxID=1293035 RepID=UPI001157A14C|nr:M56 family metallopeptidase [Chitinophaga polysaccharea]
MNVLPITGDFVRALGWTILHSMWQAFFIYACLRIVLKLWPQAGARIKYNLSLLSLSGIFTWFLATLYIHVQRLQEAREAIQHLGGTITMQEPLHIAAVYPNQDPLIWLFPNLELCFPFLVTLYIAGMTGMIIKLLSDLFQLRKIRTTRIEPMGEAWDKHLDKLAARLQIPCKVKLLISRHVQVPVMLGFIKPLILLPVAMVNNLTEAQLEAVLLHELAHIKRNDYLLNIFQSIVETILFFNPFVWLISKIIRMEREHCCDDLVIASTVQPLQYAHALVALEEYRLTANRLTMAAADSKQHLFNRIKRIMEMKTKHLNYSQKFLAVLIIATGLISIAWLNPAKGKNNNEQQEPAKVKTAATTGTSQEKVPVAEPDETTRKFRQQLAAAIRDTVLPAPPPAPVPAEAPANTPEPAGAPSPSPAPAPLAPLTPLKEDLSLDLSDIQVSGQGNVSTNVNTKVNVNKNTKHTVNTNHSQVFNFDYQFNKDEVRQQIRDAQKSIQEAMKQLNDVNMKKVQADIAEATKNIKWEEVSAEARKAQEESLNALKNIDWSKLNDAQKEAAEALKKIDFTTLNKNLQMAYANMNTKAFYDKVSKETKESLKHAATSLEEARKNREEALANAARIRENIARDRENAKRVAEGERRAKEGAERARIAEKMTQEGARRTEEGAKRAEEGARRAKEAEERVRTTQAFYKEMISQMEADKLLDTQKGYKLEKNENGLFINGVKQPNNVVDKYQKYLKGKQITLQSSSNSQVQN